MNARINVQLTASTSFPSSGINTIACLQTGHGDRTTHRGSAPAAHRNNQPVFVRPTARRYNQDAILTKLMSLTGPQGIMLPMLDDLRDSQKSTACFGKHG
jgi:hypothetical protein